jgi:transposase
VLPLSPGRRERHGFEYYRHSSAEFVAFLSAIVPSQPKGKEIHVILDNLSAHKTSRVGQFLADHPNVELHFTPTYSSWLNQVEIWFSKIERPVIARRVFTSVSDLARRLMRYIRLYNRSPKPIKWTYRDPAHRIRGIASSVTGN